MKLLKVDGAVPMSENASSSPLPETLDLCAAHLVFDYLTQNCYAGTASAFLAQWLGSQKEAHASVLSPAEMFATQTLEYRRHVRDLILNGSIAEAIQYLEEYFPQVLSHAMQDGPQGDEAESLKFFLLCQQFVEMIRRGDSTAALEFTDTTLTPLAQLKPSLLTHLQEVVVLLAYADPAESPVKHLLSLNHRQELASSVNAAILKSRESPLETVLRQLVLLHSQDCLSGRPKDEGELIGLDSLFTDMI